MLVVALPSADTFVWLATIVRLANCLVVDLRKNIYHVCMLAFIDRDSASLSSSHLPLQDTSVAKLFNRVRIWYLNPEVTTSTNTPSSISISHWACARVLHAVANHCPDLLYAHAAITLPLIFLNRQVSLFRVFPPFPAWLIQNSLVGGNIGYLHVKPSLFFVMSISPWRNAKCSIRARYSSCSKIITFKQRINPPEDF